VGRGGGGGGVGEEAAAQGAPGHEVVLEGGLLGAAHEGGELQRTRTGQRSLRNISLRPARPMQVGCSVQPTRPTRVGCSVQP
jgi:hypothetical protein